MDQRAIISGVLAAMAMICGTLLTVQGMEQAGVACFALASTFGGYVVGLYSEPVTNDANARRSATGDDEVHDA